MHSRRGAGRLQRGVLVDSRSNQRVLDRKYLLSEIEKRSDVFLFPGIPCHSYNVILRERSHRASPDSPTIGIKGHAAPPEPSRRRSIQLDSHHDLGAFLYRSDLPKLDPVGETGNRGHLAERASNRSRADPRDQKEEWKRQHRNGRQMEQRSADEMAYALETQASRGAIFTACVLEAQRLFQWKNYLVFGRWYLAAGSPDLECRQRRDQEEHK